MNIVIATQNQHKINEITQIMPDIKFTIPSETLEITEGSRSYTENALIKAKTWSHYYPDSSILADDSGLEVYALDNQPGVISAVWAGSDSTQDSLISKLLYELKDIPFQKRQARFVCYILLLSPEHNIFISRGECFGHIAEAQSGTKGFGYDSVFLPAEYNYKKTMAELTSQQKNDVSHRNKALLGIKDYLQYIEDYHE